MSDHLEPTLQRLGERAHLRLSPEFRAALNATSDPTRAALHLDRWLSAATSSGSFLALLDRGDRRSVAILGLLADSHQVADVLAQNPELGSLLWEDLSPPDVPQLLAEGRRLLEPVHSTSHRLDRLRLLKQRWMLVIGFADVNDLWPQPQVWRTLSDLAEALVQLLLETLWPSFATERGLAPECPLSIVAFGKLGGHELNFSSDIDLCYILDDDATEETERHVQRFCAIFGRAIEERMGRGQLYRVDLRLRPYGGAGQIAYRWHAVEAYYERYSETWEQMAMLRSRVIAGPGANRWDALRRTIALNRPRGIWQIEELLDQRQRLEELSKGDDLKRGPGGIRDVEFLTQCLQLLHARRHPELDFRPTREAITALADAALLPREDAELLDRGYTFLRKLEHRIQLDGNLQTHTVPTEDAQLDRLARSLGFAGRTELLAELNDLRTRIRQTYERWLIPLGKPGAAEATRSPFGGAGVTVEEWLRATDPTGALLEAALDSQHGLDRLILIAERAPRLTRELHRHPEITEQIVSGEILEIAPPPRVGDSAPARAHAIARWKWRQAARWILDPHFNLASELDTGLDELLKAMLAGQPLEAVALGSYAAHESGVDSDADLVLFCPEGVRHLDAEQAAQEFLREIQTLRQLGAPISMDLRLRPEGRSGLLARTHEGFAQYGRHNMEPWEKVACGRARLIIGSPRALEEVASASQHLPRTEEAFDGLMRMKHRLETERVASELSSRHLKHGPGGFDDLFWLTQLASAFCGQGSPASHGASVPYRLGLLAQQGWISASEQETMIEAHRLQLTWRWAIELRGEPRDLLPAIHDWTWPASSDWKKVVALRSTTRAICQRVWDALRAALAS